MFEPISQTPRYKLAAQQIIDQIEAGALTEGQKMPTDRELVEALGVSRATVREAMIALEIMGYVETRFGSGAYVTRPGRPVEPSKPIASKTGPGLGPFELLEARRLIEAEVTALAAKSITPAQLDRLWDCTQLMESDGSANWNETADEDFHRTIAEAAGNAALTGILSEFWRQQRDLPMWQSIRARVDLANLRPSLAAEHQAIIDALTEGDPDAARDAMNVHLFSFSHALLDGWDNSESDDAPKRRFLGETE